MCYDMNCKYQKRSGECNRPGARYPADSACMMENAWMDPMDIIEQEGNDEEDTEEDTWK